MNRIKALSQAFFTVILISVGVVVAGVLARVFMWSAGL